MESTMSVNANLAAMTPQQMADKYTDKYTDVANLVDNILLHAPTSFEAVMAGNYMGACK